ncbi:SURF1 family protein [Sneathiella chinensis]|uniref:SURF1-like protein n=1 Tax=Sneathiella chinensis TaxID=349750 RepID=A0ABQ5U0D5_9PROT|nr:SURF1 family protein [Sneathiella chinensis]GLQ05672.1 SURF1-like protein [Sneathiella chinensis]
MKKFSPGILPTLITVPVIVILLALSLWQANRYFWKVDLLEGVQQQLAADPVVLPEAIKDVEAWIYRRVTLTGTYDHSREIHLFAHTEKGRKGFQIITPFVRQDGGQTVLVNRGWVPEGLKEPASRQEGLIEGAQAISGIVRKPWFKSMSFLPESNEETNVWLYGELDRMAAHLGLEVAPVFVELDDSPVPGGWPKGGQTRVSVPNNHIEYAITWFGLAMAMAAIYGLYGVRRASRRKDDA